MLEIYVCSVCPRSEYQGLLLSRRETQIVIIHDEEGSSEFMCAANA